MRMSAMERGVTLNKGRFDSIKESTRVKFLPLYRGLLEYNRAVAGIDLKSLCGAVALTVLGLYVALIAGRTFVGILGLWAFMFGSFWVFVAKDECSATRRQIALYSALIEEDKHD